MKKLIATIQNCNIWQGTDGRCWMVADADIDCDGSGGNPDHDPYFQPDTSLHDHEGKALNAYTVPFIVLPPAAMLGVTGRVLGCRARVHYLETGKIAEAVVGDQGPRLKVGELSVECARRLGMPSNPNAGGCQDFSLVLYEWWPGFPAVVDGVIYPLQHFGQ